MSLAMSEAGHHNKKGACPLAKSTRHEIFVLLLKWALSPRSIAPGVTNNDCGNLAHDWQLDVAEDSIIVCISS